MKQYEELVARAEAAGKAAAAAAVPVPMVVSWREGSAVRQEFVEGGVCGFGWVEIPGNTAFGRWMKKVGKARPTYPKGLYVSNGLMTQSMARNEAYAIAYANVLEAAGLEARACSRID